ncbi:MAG: hypothetical protein ACRDP5_29205 [Streptosporangiaceae bacterium]
MRLRSRPRTIVAWSSGRVARHGVHAVTRSTRARRIRWWLRTGVLLAIIGVVRVARTARTYPRPALSLAGTAVTMAGLMLPSRAVLVSGFLVLFLAMFLPLNPAAAPAKPSSARLWAEPLIPWDPATRHRPPYR